MIANRLLMQRIWRLCSGEHLVGNQACIVHTSIGIDTQAMSSAPDWEPVRVYVSTDNPQAFSLLAFAAYLGIPEPFVKGAMEFVTVLKYGEQPGEVAGQDVVLPFVATRQVKFFESGNYSCYTATSADGTRSAHMQTDRLPASRDFGPAPGVWYGSEQRLDAMGHVWERTLGDHVCDDFGVLVPVPPMRSLAGVQS